jgi:3-hydroxyisobutyrate dehydrogenase
MKIAFLGAGLMGSGFVRRLRAQGHEVNVWNRNAARAVPLAEQTGARAVADARDAVRGMDRIQLSLADDASVDAVLEPLVDAIQPGTWLIDHTTTATTPTAERAARWAARGVRFVHAPVFMGPSNAAEGTGLMLLSGERALCDAITPMMQEMTGKVIWMGEAPERAASFKLFGNLVLIGMSGVLGDVARLAHSVGIAPTEAMTLFQHFNPGAARPARAGRIVSGDYSTPSFEVAMARKDARLMVEEAKRHGVDLAVMPAVIALFDAAIARGEGALDSGAAMRWPVK